MLITVFKHEFRLAHFGINYDRHYKFERCQWQRSPEVSKLYLVYRLLLAGYFVGSLIAVISEPESTSNSRQKWPIYLTNWGYTICMLQTVCGAFIVTKKFYCERKQASNPPVENVQAAPTPLPWFYKVYWILHTVAVVLAVGITIAYWSVIYQAEENVTASNLIVHAFNAVFMILDLYLVSHPFRLLHFYWPVNFVAVYLIFSAIYYACGGLDYNSKPYIYPMLNWEKGGITTGVCVVGLLFVFGVHFFVWLLFLLRRFIYEKCVKKEKVATVSYSDSSMHFDYI